MTDMSALSISDLDDIFAKRTPPPEGMYDVSDDLVCIPSSNTGCTALVDYLSFTTLLVSHPRFKFYEIGLAEKMLNRVMPETSLRAHDFEERGLFGYRYSADVYAPDCDQPCGKMAMGGNGDTLLVSIPGAGCPFIGSTERLAENFVEMDAKITRVDLAYDDFEGQYLDMDFLSYLARTGFFVSINGKHAKRIKYDDLNSLAGNTITIGFAGDRELTFYEKGKQLQSAYARWIRCEVRLWAKNRRIPYGVLTNGGSFMRGAYPQLTSFLPLQGSKRAPAFRAQAEATIEASDRFLQNYAGRELRLKRLALSDEDYLKYTDQLLTKSGMSGRWKKTPEQLVTKMIGEHAERELTCI